MNRLIYLVFVASASAGLVLWQQASLDGVQQHIARLAGELVAVRTTVETERAQLSATRRQFEQLRGALGATEQKPDAAPATDGLTPALEGWWPNDKSYFYLPKSYLAQVQFRACRLPIAEVNARLTKRAVAVNPNVQSVNVSPDADGQGSFVYRLFENGKLNRDMAVLLGMGEGESERVDALFAGLVGSIQKIEAERIEWVNPPEPAGTGLSNQWVIARMPELWEAPPLRDAFSAELRQCIGDSRAKVLLDQMEQYFDEYADRLGSLPREFIRQNNLLIIRYTGSRRGEMSARHQRGECLVMPTTREMEYGHLFGPGAPCELK